MRLRDRTLPVEAAECELTDVLLAFEKEHDLTDVEMLRALQLYEYRLSRRLLRAERHPGEPDRKADEA